MYETTYGITVLYKTSCQLMNFSMLVATQVFISNEPTIFRSCHKQKQAGGSHITRSTQEGRRQLSSANSTYGGQRENDLVHLG